MGMFNIVESATVWGVQRKVLDLRAAAPVVPRVLFHYTTRWGGLSEIFGENHGKPPDFMVLKMIFTIWLVVWNIFIFPIILGCHDPN